MPLPKRSRLIDRDLSRDRLLCLLQRQGQDAVIELGADLLLVDLVRQRKRAGEVADIVLGVERLQPLVFGEIDPSFNPKHVVFDINLDILLFDSRDFHHDGQGVVGFVDVAILDVVAGGNCLLLLGDELFFLLYREFLRLCHLRFCHFTLRLLSRCGLCHGDRFRLVTLRAREIKRKYPVAVFSLDPVRVDFDREGHRAIETPGQSLAAMEARLFAILDRFGAGKADRSVLDLDLQVGLPDAGQLGDDDDVVALAKDIERRKSAAAADTRLQPAASAQRIESLLELEKSAEWVGEQHGHGSYSWAWLPGTRQAGTRFLDAGLDPRSNLLSSSRESSRVRPTDDMGDPPLCPIKYRTLTNVLIDLNQTHLIRTGL